MKTPLPDPLMFGYWGFAPLPCLMLISSKHKDNAALIAHEQCHQSQQRRDGWLTFWWRYLTNKEKRFNYELEAYKVWLKIKPSALYKVAYWLEHNYGLGKSKSEIYKLLLEDK